jgi:phytoene/squalene synthetase
MTNQETRPKIKVDSGTLAAGNRICKAAVKQSFGDYLWIAGNLPGDRQTALYALLNHVIRAADYLDLESSDGLPLDVWCEFRDDLSDAFMDQYVSADLVALVDACRRFKVPRQYLFDILSGVDLWIRSRRIETYDDLLNLTCRFGGAAMAAAVPIVGFTKDGYQQPAYHAGQAILMTQLLANLVQDIKLNKNFFALDDIQDTELSISRIKVRQPHPGLKHLVRLYGSRIEKLMLRAAGLTEYLDFDARRSFTSLLAVHWEMLMRMRLNPFLVLEKEGVLGKRRMFEFKVRHVLGLEGNLPILSPGDAAH